MLMTIVSILERKRLDGFKEEMVVEPFLEYEGVDDEKLSPFLVILSIQWKQQREGILVEISEPGVRRRSSGVVMIMTLSII